MWRYRPNSGYGIAQILGNEITQIWVTFRRDIWCRYRPNMECAYRPVFGYRLITIISSHVNSWNYPCTLDTIRARKARRRPQQSQVLNFNNRYQQNMWTHALLITIKEDIRPKHNYTNITKPRPAIQQTAFLRVHINFACNLTLVSVYLSLHVRHPPGCTKNRFHTYAQHLAL